MGTDGIERACAEEKVTKERRREKENARLRQEYANYREEIDCFLEKKAYEELLSYQETDKFRKVCNLDSEAAIMNVVLCIYRDERKNHCEENILAGIHTMKEARRRFLQAKFVMWKLEFFDENDLFLDFLEKNPVSSYFLMHLIYTSSFEKGDAALKMAMLLKEKRRFAQAFAMLNYLDQICPGEEVVYCEMADICIITGQAESAANCIGRIKEPTAILAGYRRKWGI